MTWLLIAVGGLVGAPSRYLLDTAVSSQLHRSAVPWGTMLVNICGSFVLGVLAGATVADGRVFAVVGTGFCGAFTTFSTFAWEAFALAEDGRPRAALVTVALGLVLGLAAAAAGYALA